MNTGVDFIQHVQPLKGYLFAFAMKLTKDKHAAEDLYQDTLLSAFRHYDKFRNGTNLKAWMSTIMKNAFINLYRKNQRRNELQDNTKEGYYFNSSDTEVKNDGESNVEVEEITGLIKELKDGYRIPFLMAFQGYQYDEIQRKMGGLPMGTVKSRIHHARKLLKDKIQKRYTYANV